MIGDRLTALLLQQAHRRGAPDWVVRFLTGDDEKLAVAEAGGSRLTVTGEDGAVVQIEARLLLPPRTPVDVGPWRPDGIELPDGELRRLSYIVVDEIVDDAAVVSVSPWPAVDEQGRLVFPDEPSIAVIASAERLVRYLSGPRFVGDPPESLRMGDAFAARVRAGRLSDAEGSLLPPSAWLLPPVYDLHETARRKGKEAFYAAVAPTLREAEAQEIRDTKRRT